jgi:hypothetical protein
MSALETRYFGYGIRIEPYEWGYVAEITMPESADRVVAASLSVMGALDQAFDYVDHAVAPPSE